MHVEIRLKDTGGLGQPPSKFVVCVAEIRGHM